MKILVVDDDFLGREILLSFLKEYGSCDSACNGKEALDKFCAAREAGAPFDLICLDMLMPVLDGNQVLTAIREAESGGAHRSCVFIITGHESPELIESSGMADDFISKPCSANLIKRLLERHHLLDGVVSEKHSILVVSGDPAIRVSIVNALDSENICLVDCSTFAEAERAAFTTQFSAVVADIPTVVKSRDDEKLALISLQNIFPFVRVKISAGLVQPIIMSPEERGQGLVSYLVNTCSTFIPRCLRAYKRHKLFVPVQIRKDDGQEYQTFTLDISWGGAFIVMNNSWGLIVGNTLSVFMPTLNFTIVAEIIRVQNWGKQGVAPGLGIKWKTQVDVTTIEGLHQILKTRVGSDFDRLLG